MLVVTLNPLSPYSRFNMILGITTKKIILDYFGGLREWLAISQVISYKG